MNYLLFKPDTKQFQIQLLRIWMMVYGNSLSPGIETGSY